VNFDLLFPGAKFFHNGYLAHFVSEHDEMWQRWGLANFKLIPRISWTLVWGSRDTLRRRHSSFTGILVKWFFPTFVLVSLVFRHLPCLPIV